MFGGINDRNNYGFQSAPTSRAWAGRNDNAKEPAFIYYVDCRLTIVGIDQIFGFVFPDGIQTIR